MGDCTEYSTYLPDLAGAFGSFVVRHNAAPPEAGLVEFRQAVDRVEEQQADMLDANAREEYLVDLRRLVSTNADAYPNHARRYQEQVDRLHRSRTLRVRFEGGEQVREGLDDKQKLTLAAGPDVVDPSWELAC